MQLREAQDEVPCSLKKLIYEAEHKVLSTFFTMNKLPVGVAMMIVWKTINYKYVRYVDFGVLSGLCENVCSSWPANNVLDRIATSTDIKRLATLKRKKRENEIDKAFNSVSCLSTAQHSKLSFFLVIVEDSGHNIRHISHGTCFQSDAHVSRCHHHILEPGVDTDHTSVLRDFFSVRPQTLNFQQQMTMINCLPAVNVSFNNAACTPRQSVAEGRVLNACKYLFVRADMAGINAAHAAGASCIAYRRRGAARKRIVSTSFAETDDSDSDCCDHDTATNEPVGERTSFTVPVVENFKFLLQRQGLVRVIKKSDFEIDIIWSKFDAVKGM